MISRDPKQVMLYNARRKLQLDDEARMILARQEAMREGRAEGLQEGREEGREEGRRKGQLEGRIVVLQEFLGQRVFTAEDFASHDAAHLQILADQLQQQLRSRRS